MKILFHGKLRGSVTVYLALTFCVLSSLMFALIFSVKVNAGRMQAANSIDQAMYSLFAKYDQRLEAKYGLFFIDAGGGQGGPDLAACISEIEDASDRLLCPNDGLPFLKGMNLLRLERLRCSVTGCLLATDAGGAAFASQAEQAVLDTCGIRSISRLKELLAGFSETGESGKELLKRSGETSYSDIREESGRVKRELAEQAAEEGTEVPEVLPPPGFVNPIPYLQDLMSRSVLDIAAPEGVSAKEADLSLFVSGRTLSAGFGIQPGRKAGRSQAFRTFLMKNFSNYDVPSENSALMYQLEYILCGKNSDLANMKEVVKRLMAVREAANIACIYRDPRLTEEVSSIASIIAAVLLVPEAEEAIRLLLAAGWAYAESIADIRALFLDKRVSLIKSGDYWQTDLSRITEFSGDLDSLTVTDPYGLNYEEYLGILLLKNGKNAVARAMDMAESEIRGEGREDFRLDHCIAALDTETEILSEGKVRFRVRKSLSYEDL